MTWSSLLNQTRRRKSVTTDHRTDFRRDFDRVLFSTPFRRLQDKAQVFPLESHDAIRTRLTHSLEVAVVSRGIASAVTEQLLREGKLSSESHKANEQANCIEEIAATCGIIHDLGNPPFGHAGEEAIKEWFQRHLLPLTAEGWQYQGKTGPESQLAQDLLNFEGNAQTLRLLTKLQILANKDLNLTYGTLSAARKYIAPSDSLDPTRQPYKKPGYFASENNLFDEISRKTATVGVRNPITFLVESADDIVYSFVDVEDAVRKGVTTWKEVYDYFLSEFDRLGANDPQHQLFKSIIDKAEAYSRLKASLVGPRDQEFVQLFRIFAITRCVPTVAETFLTHYDEIMEGEYFVELYQDSRAATTIETAKQFVKTFVYPSGEVLKLELKGRKIIQDLMDFFNNAVADKTLKQPSRLTKFPDKAFQLMSDNYKNAFVADQKNLPIEYCRLKLVTDYISGMTDTFASRLHSEVFGPV